MIKRTLSKEEITEQNLKYIDGFQSVSEIADGYLITFDHQICSTLRLVVPKEGYVVTKGLYQGEVYTVFDHKRNTVSPSLLPPSIRTTLDTEVIFGEIRRVNDSGLLYDAFYIAENPLEAKQAIVIKVIPENGESDNPEGSLRHDLWYCYQFSGNIFDTTGDEWLPYKRATQEQYQRDITEWIKDEERKTMRQASFAKSMNRSLCSLR